MVGRAGRPQFDTEGVAVIMTQRPVGAAAAAAFLPCLHSFARCSRGQCSRQPLANCARLACPPQHIRRYEQLMGGSELVESQLKEVLPELLNAELTLRTIGDVSQASPAVFHAWAEPRAGGNPTCVPLPLPLVLSASWWLARSWPGKPDNSLDCPLCAAHLQAIEWVRATYLYVRVQRSPARYGVPAQPSTQALDAWLKDRLVLATVRELAQHGMVRLLWMMPAACDWPAGLLWSGQVLCLACRRLTHFQQTTQHLAHSAPPPRAVPHPPRRCVCTTMASGWSRCSRA